MTRTPLLTLHYEMIVINAIIIVIVIIIVI